MDSIESADRLDPELSMLSDLEAFHDEFVHLVLDSQRVMRDALDPICESHGLSQQQMLVLLILLASPGSRMGDVSDELGILRTNFTQVAHRMEERGLVRRTQDENDRRSFALDLTDEGRALVASMRDEFAFRNRHVAASVSQQTRDDLVRGLAAMREVVSALDRRTR